MTVRSRPSTKSITSLNRLPKVEDVTASPIKRSARILQRAHARSGLPRVLGAGRRAGVHVHIAGRPLKANQTLAKSMTLRRGVALKV